MCTLHKTRLFSRSGSITIPREWRERFGLLPGRQAEFIHEAGSILIREALEETTYNKAFISEKGTVNIPKELREELGIQPRSIYHLYADDEEQGIVMTR